MEAASLCLIISATMSIHPDRSQFFRYESFTLDCVVPGSLQGWTVKRNTSLGSYASCQEDWGKKNGSSCVKAVIYTPDHGAYWCQSEAGECSRALNITVTTDTVILESPALPVSEGDDVTLRCSHKERYRNKTSDFNATFYRDDVFIGTYPGAQMVIQAVSKDKEGFYKCGHPTRGQSPQSFLSVRVRPPLPPTPAPPLMPLPKLLCVILLFILYNIIFILAIYTCRRRAKARAEAKRGDYNCVN